ncbi:MAG TPA: hypothetical protein VH561_09130 [Micromonosporaceae bacterium]
MGTERVPVDPASREAYARRVRSGACFICTLLAGEPGHEHWT